MKLMLIFSYGILLLTCISCSLKISKPRLYGRCGYGYFACSQFLINPNNTFENFSFMDVGGASIIKGSWEILNKDTIILNSYLQPKISKTYYIGEMNKAQDDSIIIKIKDCEGPVIWCQLQIDDSKILTSANLQDKFFFKTNSIDSIKINYLDNKIGLKISNPKFNLITIYLEDNLNDQFKYKYITNRKLIVRRNKIVFCPDETIKRKYVMRRNNMHKKQWK